MATVTILPVGELTPSQVLATALNDPDFAEVEAVVVMSLLKDGNAYLNCSSLSHGDMTYLLAKFHQHVVSTI